MAAAFPDHAYGRPVDGTEESVQSITVEQMRAFHRNTIARRDLTVAVVGAITEERLIALLDRVFGGLPDEPQLIAGQLCVQT